MTETNVPGPLRGWAAAMRAHRESLLHLSVPKSAFQLAVPKSVVDLAREANAQARVSRNRAFLPPNLRPLHDQIDAGEVIEIIRSEGIPLAPVPRAAIALEIIQAGDREQRREVLSRRALDIAEDCREVLEQCNDPEGLTEFAREGIEALNEGFTRSAQALFTVLATTLVDNIDFEGDPSWSAARRIKREMKYELERFPEEIDDLPSYMFWVAAPMWHAFPSALFGEGAELPDRWARNASTHAVSDAHYNAANCVTAMMFVTALMDLADVESEL